MPTVSRSPASPPDPWTPPPCGAAVVRWAVRNALPILLLFAACGDTAGAPETPRPEGTVYVDAAAKDGGTGAQQAPLKSITGALETGIPHVVVAPGTYEFPSAWTFPVDYVVEAPDGAFVTTGGAFEAQGALTLSGFQIFGRLEVTGDLRSTGLALTGQNAGLSVSDGAIALDDVSMEQGQGALFTHCEGTVTGFSAKQVIAPVFTSRDSSLVVSTVTIEGAVQTEEGASGDGFVVDGGDVTLEDATVSAPDDRAFFSKRGATTLRRVRLSGGGRPPLGSADEADVTVEDSEIFAANTCLFATGGGRLTVRNTDVHDCGFGVLSGMGATVEIRDSRFTNCPGGHFSALNDGTQVLLEDNEFSRSDSTCIALAGTNGPGVRVARNRVEDCVGQGISLLSLQGAEIADNTIRGVTADPVFTDVGDGIGLVDAFAVVRGNIIQDVDRRGIGLLRSGGDFDGNEIADTGDLGISVVDPAGEPVEIRNNKVERAFGGGITVLNADAVIEGNDVRDIAANPELGTGDGITFGLSSTSQVTGNTVAGAAINGIVFAEGATGSIQDNTVTDSAAYGIREYCFSEQNTVVVGENTLSGNALGEQQLCQ